MRNGFKWFILLLVAIVPLIGIYIVNNPMLMTEVLVDTGGFAKGESLPLMTGEDVTGGKVDISAYQGKSFVVMMAKIDCETCKSSYPMLQQWQANYPNTPLVMLGVGTKDEYAQVKRKMNFQFPLVTLDDEKQNLYRMKITPVFYLIDASGKVADRMNGYRVKEFQAFMERATAQ
ncbi:TlpA family protein disulfide reductase [Brevibacillus sp. SYSU BS000544]|uniref:TlpA family protein disulfide reductase n=1 Tax=Brevibacillus sp. SYSU BS000544 TaxID=3416443 RepID=UPI003CE5807C